MNFKKFFSRPVTLVVLSISFFLIFIFVTNKQDAVLKTSTLCLLVFVTAESSSLLVAKIKIKKNDIDKTTNVTDLEKKFLKFMI